MEKTLVLIKPEGIQNYLIGGIIGEFEDSSYMLKIEEIKMIKPTKKLRFCDIFVLL